MTILKEGIKLFQLDSIHWPDWASPVDPSSTGYPRIEDNGGMLSLNISGRGIRLQGGGADTQKPAVAQTTETQFLCLRGPADKPAASGHRHLVLEKGHGILWCDYNTLHFGVLASPIYGSPKDDPYDPLKSHPTFRCTAEITTDARGDIIMSRRVGTETETNPDGSPKLTRLLGVHVHWPFDLGDPQGPQAGEKSVGEKFIDAAPIEPEYESSCGMNCRFAAYLTVLSGWNHVVPFTMAYQDLIFNKGKRLWLTGTFSSSPGQSLSRQVALRVTRFNDSGDTDPMEYDDEQLRIGWVGMDLRKFDKEGKCPASDVTVPRNDPGDDSENVDLEDDLPLIMKAKKIQDAAPGPGEVKYHYRTYFSHLYLQIKDPTLTDSDNEENMRYQDRGRLVLLRSPLKSQCRIVIDTSTDQTNKFSAILSPMPWMTP